MDYIIFNQDELLNITLIGFIGLCDNEYVIPECHNVTFAAIGNVRVSVCMTAEECCGRNVRFLNFVPQYIPKYANVPLVRDGALKTAGSGSFSTSYASSYASSYITSYASSFLTSYTTSFASSYMYEFEYEYQTSYSTSYRSSYSTSYRSSYAASYSSSYSRSAVLMPYAKRKNSREIIAVNGYGINLI